MVSKARTPRNRVACLCISERQQQGWLLFFFQFLAYQSAGSSLLQHSIKAFQKAFEAG